MKKIIDTIKNIWSIEDLRSRILFTLGILAVYRLGVHVVLPGVNASALSDNSQDGLLGLLNMFTGGAFANASIFALGIMPYISASIVIQLLGMAIPYFQKLQREGESGRRKINSITRYLTILICAGQAPGYIVTQITSQPGLANNPDPLWWTTSVVILITGTMFVMWLEKITDRGIGNGISLLIMIGIIANLPSGLMQEVTKSLDDPSQGCLVMFLVEMAALLIVIMISILLVQGTRRIPVQYAKRVVEIDSTGCSAIYSIKS